MRLRDFLHCYDVKSDLRPDIDTSIESWHDFTKPQAILSKDQPAGMLSRGSRFYYTIEEDLPRYFSELLQLNPVVYGVCVSRSGFPDKEDTNTPIAIVGFDPTPIMEIYKGSSVNTRSSADYLIGNASILTVANYGSYVYARFEGDSIAFSNPVHVEVAPACVSKYYDKYDRPCAYIHVKSTRSDLGNVPRDLLFGHECSHTHAPLLWPLWKCNPEGFRELLENLYPEEAPFGQVRKTLDSVAFSSRDNPDFAYTLTEYFDYSQPDD